MNGAGVAGAVGADGVSRKCLELISTNPRLGKLSDRLTPLKEKHKIFYEFLENYFYQYPPDQWTSNDCEFLINEVEKVFKDNDLHISYKGKFYINNKSVEVGQGWSWSQLNTWPRSNLYLTWLFSTSSVESLIPRSQYLKQMSAFREIDKLVHHDVFITCWLNELGFDSYEKVLAVVRQLQRNNASFLMIEDLVR